MPTIQTDIDTALKAIRAKLSDYNHYLAYAEGRQNLAFATDKYTNAFGSLFREFADNLCPGIIDATADRLIVTGFGVEEGNAALGEQAWKIWQANRMDQRSGEAHQSALTQGDSYVMVWPNAEGVPVIHINDARTMYIRYDEEEPGKVLWAAKAWVTQDKLKRVNLYYPDRIEKYVSRNPGTDFSIPDNSKTLIEYSVEGEAWPLLNTYERVPVFHLANNAPPGRFGTSELKHVIPLQDALNKSVSDMLVAMEFLAFPQRWATGISIPIDPTTNKPIQPFNPATDRFWATTSETAHFGQLPAADLANFLQVSDSFRLEIARISGTPLHYMSLITDPPSGEALKTLEARFVKKVRDRQATFGNVWENVMSFALAVTGQPNVRLNTQWADAAPISTKEAAEVGDMYINRLSMTPEYVWANVLDLPQSDIDEMLAAKAAKEAEMQKLRMQEMQIAANAPTSEPDTVVPASERTNGRAA